MISDRDGRAEKLDAMMQEFDSRPQLVRARVVLDWNLRTVGVGDTSIRFSNADALEALNIYDGTQTYSPEQTTIRDVLDALLVFFDRPFGLLGLALSSAYEPWMSIPRMDIRGTYPSPNNPNEFAVYTSRGMLVFTVNDRNPWLQALGPLPPGG